MERHAGGTLTVGTATAIQTSYNGGELSARMEGRVDQGLYQVATAEMFNFVPSVEGPAIKRPGFMRVYAAPASASWLSSFIYSRTQAYAIEWSDGQLRFFTNGGIVEVSPGSPFALVVPYTGAEAPSVWQQQSYDRLYLTHPAHAPGSVLRTDAITFTYAPLSLVNGPFADQNVDQTIAVTVTGALTVGGVATITSPSAIFLPGHVGSPVQVEAADFSTMTAWEPQMKVAVGMFRRSEGKVYLAVDTPNERTGTIQPIHTHGSEWDGNANGDDINGKGPFGVLWEYQHDRFGVGTITAVAPDGLSATVDVTRAFPFSLQTVASYRWSLPCFSAATQWPKIVLLAFGRLIFFTDFEIIGSVVADYGGGRVNMAIHDDAGVATPDMAFRRRLDISNPVLWAQVDRTSILVGTADGEYAIGKTNAGEIFSGANMECVPQSRYGGSPVKPVQTGTSTLFVQKNGRKLREANYAFSSDRYEAPNINVWQRHILKSGTRQLTFQQEPEEMVYVVRMDGIIALHPHVPEQEIKGFARAQHGGGLVISAVAVPGGMGATDDLWILVQAPDGSKGIELQAPWWEEGETDITDAFFVDSGVTVVAPSSKVITGATWLANRQVAVLADGGVLPLQTVSPTGVLDLTDALGVLPVPGKVTFGMPYQARLTWLRPELRGPSGGTIQSKRKRLAQIALRLIETLGVKVDPGNGKPELLINRPGSSSMDAPVPLYSGDTIPRAIGGQWERDGQGTIISDDPLPCSVVAHIPSLTFEGAS